MLQVIKKTKIGFNLPVDISRTTTATASKSCVIVCLQFTNIFSKSGVWTRNALEILKVRIKAKFELIDISSITTATASKPCISLRLDFSKIFSKTGVWTENGMKMLKVQKKSKFDFNLPVDISRTTKATASKSCVILRLDFSNSFSKLVSELQLL